MKYINYSGVYVSKEPVIHTKRLKKPSPVCQESTARAEHADRRRRSLLTGNSREGWKVYGAKGYKVSVFLV